MAYFLIENVKSRHIFGVYEADDARDALAVYAREAGYPDFTAALEVAPVDDDEIVAREFTQDETDLFDDAVAKLLTGPGGDSGYAFRGDELVLQRIGYAELVLHHYVPGMDADDLADAVRDSLAD